MVSYHPLMHVAPVPFIFILSMPQFTHTPHSAIFHTYNKATVVIADITMCQALLQALSIY